MIFRSNFIRSLSLIALTFFPALAMAANGELLWQTTFTGNLPNSKSVAVSSEGMIGVIVHRPTSLLENAKDAVLYLNQAGQIVADQGEGSIAFSHWHMPCFIDESRLLVSDFNRILTYNLEAKVIGQFSISDHRFSADDNFINCIGGGRAIVSSFQFGAVYLNLISRNSDLIHQAKVFHPKNFSRVTSSFERDRRDPTKSFRMGIADRGGDDFTGIARLFNIEIGESLIINDLLALPLSVDKHGQPQIAFDGNDSFVSNPRSRNGRSEGEAYFFNRKGSLERTIQLTDNGYLTPIMGSRFVEHRSRSRVDVINRESGEVVRKIENSASPIRVENGDSLVYFTTSGDSPITYRFNKFDLSTGVEVVSRDFIASSKNSFLNIVVQESNRILVAERDENRGAVLTLVSTETGATLKRWEIKPPSDKPYSYISTYQGLRLNENTWIVPIHDHVSTTIVAVRF